ncbi:hypothetical protein K788_0005106 (plasmid) [Paraburkholderia caribensis MBA4]|uniref:Uncharacterized protein n=1 Tax=Paraburkholderia caribensis MBA4 TaxID=1323664 RepID=A0A0N7JVJ7_9BURK|nr:hypothetical protein K788_0005106 [Paraburkholderia caribensis MBA4]
MVRHAMGRQARARPSDERTRAQAACGSQQTSPVLLKRFRQQVRFVE